MRSVLNRVTDLADRLDFWFQAGVSRLRDQRRYSELTSKLPSIHRCCFVPVPWPPGRGPDVTDFDDDSAVQVGEGLTAYGTALFHTLRRCSCGKEEVVTVRSLY